LARVVSFINFKGGVGKTTLCVETAASLVGSFNAKVLLVDLDPQTNATLSLMNEDEWEAIAKSKGTMREFFLASYEEKHFDLAAIRHFYDKHPRGKNLHLLPSHLELFGMDLQLATKFGHGDIRAKVFLRNALKQFQNEYDFILVDCPPNIYLATQNGLFASDYYLVVALAEYLSTLGLAHIQKSINGIFDQANHVLESIGGVTIDTPKLIGIIFNQVRYRTGGTSKEESIMKSIRASYGDLVFSNFVSQSTQIAGRPEEKIPIALSGYAADQKYEQQVRKVAEEFYDRITRPEP
jgi:chromosome partitioning protein